MTLTEILLIKDSMNVFTAAFVKNNHEKSEDEIFSVEITWHMKNLPSII